LTFDFAVPTPVQGKDRVTSNKTMEVWGSFNYISELNRSFGIAWQLNYDLNGNSSCGDRSGYNDNRKGASI
jgi:hypothetical protein